MTDPTAPSRADLLATLDTAAQSPESFDLPVLLLRAAAEIRELEVERDLTRSFLEEADRILQRLGPCDEELAALRQDRERLVEAINNVANGDWIIAPWHDATRVGNEFHYRVNMRDEPSKSKRSQTYTGTPYAGQTPVEAALAALAARQAGQPEGEGQDAKMGSADDV